MAAEEAERALDSGQQPRIKRQRQQILELMSAGLAPQIRQDHFEVAAKLPQNLATGAARRRWRVGVGHHGNTCELSMSLRECFEHRNALGANRKAVGGILDVAPGDDRAVGGLERRADFEVRVGGVRVTTRATSS